jgi:uncharacterized protein
VIFVDTSFWVALRNRRDQNHDEAHRLLQAHGNTTLLTTNHVRGETWTFLRRRAGHRSAVDFVEALASSARVNVVFVSDELERRALEWLRRHDEREYSFVDATSFAVMHAARVRGALTFDSDFDAAGFHRSG